MLISISRTISWGFASWRSAGVRFAGVGFTSVRSIRFTVGIASHPASNSSDAIHHSGARFVFLTKSYATIGCFAWLTALTIIYEFKGIHVCTMIDFNRYQI